MTSAAPVASGDAPVPTPPTPPTPPARRGAVARSAALVAGSAVLAVLATVIGLAVTGAAVPSLLFDPGPVVRWGLPMVTALARLSGALTIGALVLTSFVLPMTDRDVVSGGRTTSRVFAPGLRITAVAAGTWAVATVVQAVLEYGQVSGTRFDDPTFGGQLVGFVRDTDPGRGLLVTAAVAAVVTLLAAGGTGAGTTGLATVLALIALIPPALAGHAAGSSDHETAVTTLGLHLLGVSVWVGGLVALVLIRSKQSSDAPSDAVSGAVSAVRRYSRLALWSFVVVAGSGVVNALIRVPRLSGLESAYGALLLLKAMALVLLGLAGAAHRRRALPELEAGKPRMFARLVVAEVVVMAAAFGFAAALAASAPPPAPRRTAPTLAESITGYPLPPEPTPIRWLTSWQPDLLWLVLAALAAGLYAVGLRRMSVRGDRWPVLRTLAWFVGVVQLVYVTSGPPAVYGRVLFSAHMLGHMALSMVVPMFLVLGAPVTLALRTARPRKDGSRGPREWLIVAVESTIARVLSFPPVAAFLFAGSLVFFYFSPLFGLALRTHIGHELMHAHFLFAGYLFAWVLIGPDPGPGRVSYPLRLITLLAAMTFHAFFGVTLLSGSTPLDAWYFGGLGRTWGVGLLADQHAGGGIAWGIGDIPSIVMSVLIAVQWARSDDREARRRDRAADRDGDAELNSYNAMLARMAEADRRDQTRS